MSLGDLFTRYCMFQPSKGKYRPDIDGMRAAAIAMVVGYHFFPQLVPNGFIGVDVFFVISGYLIAGISLGRIVDGTFSIRDFYAKRIRRIFPALTLVMFVTMAVGALVFDPLVHSELRKEIRYAVMFLENWHMANTANYFDAATTKPLQHFWTLAIEEQFYLVFPILALVVSSLKRNRLAVLRGAVLLVFVASLGLNLTLNVHAVEPGKTYFWSSLRFWELGLGVLLAVWGSSWARFSLQWRNLLAVVALALMGTSIAVIDVKTGFPGLQGILPVAASGLLIVTGGSFVNRILGWHPLTYVGQISYSLYLWHWIVLTFYVYIVGAEFQTTGGLLTMLALSIVLAVLTFHFVESPTRSMAIGRKYIALLVVLFLSVLATGKMKPEHVLPTYATPLCQNFFHEREGWTDRWKNTPSYCPENSDAWCFDRDGRLGRVVIVGDSYANQLLPGLEAMGLDVSYIGAGSFPPVYRLERPVVGVGDWNENRQPPMDEVIETVAASNAEAVILAARWSSYRSQSDNVFAGLKNAVGKLKKDGRRLIIVLPQARATLPENWYCPSPWKKKEAAHVSAGDPEVVQAFFSDELKKELLAIDAGVMFVDVSETVKAHGLGTSEKAYFRDSGHLTESGSAVAAEALMEVLESAKLR